MPFSSSPCFVTAFQDLVAISGDCCWSHGPFHHFATTVMFRGSSLSLCCPRPFAAFSSSTGVASLGGIVVVSCARVCTCLVQFLVIWLLWVTNRGQHGCFPLLMSSSCRALQISSFLYDVATYLYVVLTRLTALVLQGVFPVTEYTTGLARVMVVYAEQ